MVKRERKDLRDKLKKIKSLKAFLLKLLLCEIFFNNAEKNNGFEQSGVSFLPKLRQLMMLFVKWIKLV